MTEPVRLQQRLPHTPPLLTCDVPGIGGRIGPELDDFRVDEIPAYTPCGSGEHRYVLVQKRGLSTPELVSILARTASVAERDIGYAGLKDKHAVTTQWMSLPRQGSSADQWRLPSSVTVLTESYHTNKLRTGHLHGNAFAIRLVDLDHEAEARLPQLLSRLKGVGLNAFGEQRFGRGGSNIDAALAWLNNPRGLRGNRARFLSKLYPSVLQAELFNRYLTRRLERGLDHLLLGEIVRLDGSGSNFVVEDLAGEQLRYEQGQLHPQGPMFGPKMRPAKAAAATLEAQVLAELGLTPAQLDALGSEAPGTRRDIRVEITDLKTLLERDDAGHPRLQLSFSLKAGAYATQVIREFCHGGWIGNEESTSPNVAEKSSTFATEPSDPSA